MTTFALLPGGGLSLRMGRPKLALPIGGRSVLERVIAALRQAGIDHILTILGPQVADMRTPAEAAGAHVLVLGAATPDMRATVEHGLRWVAEKWHPVAADSWLLVPADHPTLQPEVVRELRQALAGHADHSIFIPTHQGRRGHPTLIGWRHVDGMRKLPTGQGLNVYLRQQSEQTLEVPVSSPEVLLDLDTPEDYQRMLRRWSDG